MSNQDQLPRSIRLNQSHRRDITDAIMDEYEKQNPCKANIDKAEKGYHDLLVRSIKKSAAFKRTVKVRKEFPELSDHLKSDIDILIRKIKSDGEVNHTSYQNLFIEEFPEFKGILPESRGGNYFVLYQSGQPTVDISNDCKELKELSEANKVKSAYNKEVAQMREETFDALTQFNTTNQIREAWPEIVPYFPPHIADPNSAITVPVRTVDRLSERLGIK